MGRMKQAIGMAACLVWLLAGGLSVCAAQKKEPKKETESARRLRLLANIHRLVVLPPYFGVPPLETKLGQKTTDAQRKQQEKYRDYLQKLEASAREHLPGRLAARTAFEIVPLTETEDALKALTFTPNSLFQNGGLMRGTKFPLPDAASVRKMAQKTAADAVLLTILDAPRRSAGAILFDPLSGLTGDPPDVRSKAAFYLLLPDGTEILRDYVEALHPVTSGGGKRDYLLIDWTEAQDVTIEDFMDELTRYTPPKN